MRRAVRHLVVCTALLACLAAEARAQSAAPAEERWYGWQIAAVDAPLLAVVALGTDGGGEEAVVAGVGLLVSGPIVHGLHGERGAATGSAVARVAFPALGVLLGAHTGRGEHEAGDGHTATEGALIGGLAGYALALGIDLAI